MDEAINEHPLKHRPTNIRSKLAYSEIMHNCKQTGKYLLPGQLCVFNYSEPKYKEELDLYEQLETKYMGPGAMDAQIERAKTMMGGK